MERDVERRRVHEEEALSEEGGNVVFRWEAPRIWEQSGRGGQGVGDVKGFQRRSREEACDIREDNGLGAS